MELGKLLCETGITCPSGLENTQITGVEYDSRKVTEGSLFVCLSGRNTDGHIFAESAVLKGAAAVLAEKPLTVSAAPVIQTEDTRAALPKLAAAFYGYPAKELTIYGVTGTNGKTTITYMLRSILQAAGMECGIIGTIAYGYGDTNYEATRTTPESLELERLFREMRDRDVPCCVMEVSSHALKQGRIDGIRFDYSIFTNLTQDHMDFHPDVEDYYQAKRKLFYMTERASIINVDDAHGLRLYGELTEDGKNPLSYSFKDKKADFYGNMVETTERGSRFTMYRDGKELGELVVNTPGLFTMYNALAAAAACVQAGVPFLAIRQGLATLSGVPGRFELVENDRDVICIIDYAHTPDALEMALKTAAAIKKGKLICVFGCGGDRDRSKRPIMGRIAGEYSDYCIVTSDNPRTESQEQIAAEIEPGLYETGCNYDLIPSRLEAIRKAVSVYKKGDVILIAGKGHESYQIIGAAKTYFNDKEAARSIIEES